MNDQRLSLLSSSAFLGCALALSGVMPGYSQIDPFAIGAADYVNQVSTNGSQTNAVAFFSGNVNSPANAPNDGLNYLTLSGFGQPVAGAILRKPDFLLGAAITSPPGVTISNAPGIYPPVKAFSVVSNGGNLIFASEPGFVTIVWNAAVSNTYLISGVTVTNPAPVSIYLTDIGGSPTPAPPVSVRNVHVIPHYNSIITSSELVQVGTTLRASNNIGRIVLELRNAVDDSYVGVQVVNVRDYQADHNITVDVGTFLSPYLNPPQSSTNHIMPYVALGLGNTNPTGNYYAYQHTNNVALTDTHYGDVFATQPATGPGQIEVFWFMRGLGEIIWPYELDDYLANWPADFDQKARRIYHTFTRGGSPTKAKPVTIPGSLAPEVRIHYNGIIQEGYDPNPAVMHSTNLWRDANSGDLNAKWATGKILLHYQGPLPLGFIGFEYVEVVEYSPDFVDDWQVSGTTDWYVGDRLLPRVDFGESATNTYVAEGAPPVNPPHVYTHTLPVPAMTSPMEGFVFAVRDTTASDQIEIFWRRRGRGLPNVLWPYEMHRYTTRWPTNEPSKYQRYVRGSSPLGPGVDIPTGLNVSKVEYQQPNGHAVIGANKFLTTAPGWSLLKYTPGDSATNIVQFQVVRSVRNDDTSFFDLSMRTNFPIGTEITDSYHQPTDRPGYIYIPNANPPAWNRYDWEIYDGNTNLADPPDFKTGQIIPVNTGNLEVWWYNTNKSVAWPSMVKLYTNSWPSGAEPIVIASQRGSRPIDPAKQLNYRIYFQNDRTRAGFNPNDEHALTRDNGDGDAVFALRSDLGTNTTSEPYVLLKYRDSDDLDPLGRNRWHYKLHRVLAEGTSWDGTNYTFIYPGTAGTLVQAPFPVSIIDLPPSPQSIYVSGPAWRDRKGYYWAKSAGDDDGTANIVMRWFYPAGNGFYFPDHYLQYFPASVTKTNVPAPGSRFPWLDLYARTPGTPTNVTYNIHWPNQVPVLRVGETLVKRKFGLPDIDGQISAEILYQQSTALDPTKQSVKLIDYKTNYSVPLAQLPSDAAITTDNGMVYFTKLPPHLRNRFWYDPSSIPKQLFFKGEFRATPAGVEEPIGYLLLNVITARDKARLMGLSGDTASFQPAVSALSALASQTREVPANTEFDGLALTAGFATGRGYVTVAFNNSTNLNRPEDPISLNIIQVDCPNYRGELKVIYSDNPFDEKLTLRHSGDFAGMADTYEFEWRTRPPQNGLLPVNPPDDWSPYALGDGALDITIEGPGVYTLTDNYFICRYRPKTGPLCSVPTNALAWSDWTAPQLAEGWIKRVLNRINPFEQRFNGYRNYSVNTVVSMLQQAGGRWIGNIPLNQEGANNSGLIEIYETVLKRGIDLSVDGAPPLNYGPANDALLLAAGRISDLYMLFGNEAYADAADPTIAFGTENQQYGNVASSIHCFMNQTASLLEEELKLLRGRDDTLLPSPHTYPFYNRLIWNYTHGINGGEVAYSLNYDVFNVDDAAKRYPQGHGDAWGHYLTATKNYFRLLRNTNFTWVPRIEAVIVGGVPVSVDYEDERKFAQAAAAQARAGVEIVNLTYRNAYVEDPKGQWQGYQDSNTNLAWGVAEWGSRAGQSAYFDWVVANALLPDVYQEGYRITDDTVNHVSALAAFNLTDAAITNAFGSGVLSNSWRLVVSDFSNLPSLVTKLKNKSDAVSSHLNGRFSQSTRDLLANYQATANELDVLRNILVVEINAVLGGVSIYDPQRFAGVALSPRTQTLLVQNPQWDDLARLNRLLLADAYPAEISSPSGVLSNPLVDALKRMSPRQYQGRDNFLAALDNAIGAQARTNYQQLILASAQTAGLPEASFIIFQFQKGRVYPSFPVLEGFLQQAIGTNEFNAYYQSIIKTNIQVPSGQPVTGIQKIDRDTVPELREIASEYHTIEAQVDNADVGLNPLGLTKGTIPFDIDPSLVTQSGGQTHFEQIYQRAVTTMNNALNVFNHANNAAQLLRKQADTVTDFQQKVDERENDFTNRLIEVFGYPYPEDIGPTGTYSSGYDGPDVVGLHFNYLDLEDFTGVQSPTTNTTITGTFQTYDVTTNGVTTNTFQTVSISLSTEGLEFQKPPGWSRRRAPGEIQRTAGEIIQARLRLLKGLQDYNNLLEQIENQATLLQAQYGINGDEIQILDNGRKKQSDYSRNIAIFRETQTALRTTASASISISDAAAEFLPQLCGTACDFTSAGRGSLRLAGAIVATVANTGADAAQVAELSQQNAKEDAQAANYIELTTTRQVQGITNQIIQLRQLVRQEPALRLELFNLRETVLQAAGNYRSALARGLRLLEDRVRFRAQTAAQVQEYRYKDMAFRIFRDDAIQKFRAQFDLAARYVYLAAAAYDYETALLPGDPRGPGRDFMTTIVRAQAIGLIENGAPVFQNIPSGAGDLGLASPLGLMYNNWFTTVRSQLGFNNPETLLTRFSLRSGLFRAQTNATSTLAKQAWREALSRPVDIAISRSGIVSNLWTVPAFQKYCIVFSTNRNIAEPAIVIPFATTVTSGENYFGWPLGGGDSAYDSTHFAHKVRSVGAWFQDYPNLNLSATPNVYLFPVGTDILRSPTDNLGLTREFNVVDQLLPVPYVNPNALLRYGDPNWQNWIPVDSTLGGYIGDIRRFASFRAFPDSGGFNQSEAIINSRLIGRSVWNTRWVFILPAITLLADRDEALNTFIFGLRSANGPVTDLRGERRDGNGVSDIKFLFQTYSYTGN